MASPHVTAAQRRARLVTRHRLGPGLRTDDPVRLVADLVALHATDPATVHLSAWARGVADLEPALYERRSLVRLLGMRRTAFVVTREVAPLVLAGATRAINLIERRRTLGFLAENGIGSGDTAGWLARAEAAALAAVHERGPVLANELNAEVPLLGEQVVLARGRSYEATQSVGSRVLPLLASDGHIVRARPRGTWLSGQYAWVATRDWLDGDFEVLDDAAARVELARRWLLAFGPAPVADLKWWSGWTLGQTRTALAALDTAEVDLDRVPGVVLADDLDPVPTPAPAAALLPALDPTVMGWATREWFLGSHRPRLFDAYGNAGPTVWWEGRVVGGWGQRPDGEVVVRLLEDVGTDGCAAIDAEAARLTGWLAGVRVTPRFRTPLERELSV